MPDRSISLTAPVSFSDIEAAADGQPALPLRQISLVAYTGIAMKLQGWAHPVVIDLAGLTIASSKRPVLLNHDVDRPIGHTTGIVNSGSDLAATGVISSASQAAEEVVTSSRNGFPWECSIGCSAPKTEFIAAGKSGTANGRIFNGPVIIARRATLGEISIVPIGADGNTSALVVAKGKGRSIMEPNEVEGVEVSPEIAAERARIKSIDAPCAGLDLSDKRVSDLRAKAIDGMDMIEFMQALLDVQKKQTRASKLEASRPKVAGIRTGHHGEPMSDVVKAAQLIYLGRPDLAEKRVSAEAAQRASEFGINHAFDLMALPFVMAGMQPPRDRDDLIRAFGSNDIQAEGAFSTASSGTFATSLAILADEAFRSIAPTFAGFAKIVDVPDFNTRKLVRLNWGSGFEKLGAAGELKHATLSDVTSDVRIDTEGEMLAITRQMAYNDSLGLLGQAATQLGFDAMRAQLDTLYTLILANSGSFYGSGNNNYISGADTVLSIASLSVAISKMRKQVDEQGRSIDLAPAVLLVPPELESTGKEVLGSEYMMRIATSDRVGTSNPVSKSQTAIELAVEPRLSNSSISGYSSTAWFLLTGPLFGAYAMAYLAGKRAPTIESGQTDFSTLGIQYRGYFDFGCSAHEKRGIVASKGAA